jgi:hypothetical protein
MVNLIRYNSKTILYGNCYDKHITFLCIIGICEISINKNLLKNLDELMLIK